MYVHWLISKMYFKKYNFNELTWTVQKTKKNRRISWNRLWNLIPCSYPCTSTLNFLDLLLCERSVRNVKTAVFTEIFPESWELWNCEDRDQCLISSIQRSMFDLIYSLIFKLSVFDILHGNHTKLRVEGSFDPGRNN